MKNNITLPSRPKYQFHKLKKYGDYVDIETEKPVNVRSAAYNYGRYHGFLVVTERIDSGVRVFRAGAWGAESDYE